MYRTNLSTLERTGNQTFATESWWAVWQSAGSPVGAHGSQCFTPPRNHFRGKIRMDYSWIWAHPTKLWSPPPTSTATNRPQPGKGNRGPKPNETIMVPGSVLCLRCYVEVSYEVLTDILVRRMWFVIPTWNYWKLRKGAGHKAYCTFLLLLVVLHRTLVELLLMGNRYLFVKKIESIYYYVWSRDFLGMSKKKWSTQDRQNID